MYLKLGGGAGLGMSKAAGKKRQGFFFSTGWGAIYFCPINEQICQVRTFFAAIDIVGQIVLVHG